MSVLPTVLPVRKILAATDLSESSAIAVRAAALLAKDYGASLHLVSALPPGGDPRLDFMVQGYADHLFDKTNERLQEFAAEVPGGVSTFAQVEVKRGYAVDVILENAAKVGADLIVVGTHGRSGLKHLALGSVAEQVAKNSPIDVLLVREPVKGPFTRPLVALNATRAAFRAAARALELTDVTKAEKLTVIGAYQLPLGWESTSHAEEEVAERMFAFFTEDVEPVLAAMRDSSEKIDFIAERGDPSEVVLGQVERGNHDILLVGSHNRPRWVSGLLGDTARVFAHKARCATWLVRDVPEKHPLLDAILQDLGLRRG